MDEEPRSLKSTFSEAEKNRISLEARHDFFSQSYRDALAAAIQGYYKCLDQIGRLSLFSPNETVEDVSTADLPYLLVNFHLAELIQKQQEPLPALANSILPPTSNAPHEQRRAVLAATRDAYERFLHLLDSYGLLDSTYTKLLERYTDDPTSFSTAPPNADPTARRNAKIANFKAEKELRQKLEYLRQRPEYAAAALGDDDSGEEGGLGIGAGTGDEEAIRAVHLAHLAYSAHMAFQGLESLNRELEVLAQAPAPSAPESRSPTGENDARRRQGAHGSRSVGGDGDGYSERLDAPLSSRMGQRGGPLLNAQGKPLQPFTLVGGRQELARGVFRPGHNLPTMSIDEYLEEERRRGGIIEGGGEASMRVPEPDEDNIEKADQETMKAREWDEFKESNPRGSGNTLNRG
ncbi:hypothetical protein VTK73DRAFT_3509 [Phialemonium thermophilum]|uniref:TAP42-like protein n=1 Tax=Phialemonium thermophilum TaxID=223376 RepID=A0ABR3WYN2_9PEZI